MLLSGAGLLPLGRFTPTSQGGALQCSYFSPRPLARALPLRPIKAVLQHEERCQPREQSWRPQEAAVFTELKPLLCEEELSAGTGAAEAAPVPFPARRTW